MNEIEIIAHLKKCAEERGATIELCDTLYGEKRSSLWYGGAIASVKFPDGCIMQVDAIGDVYATLYDGHGNLCDEIRDKNNAGEFGKTMSAYFSTDEALWKAVDIGTLYLEHNNWFEISLIDPESKFHDLEWVDDSDNWEDAIRTAIECLEEAKKAAGLSDSADNRAPKLTIGDFLDNPNFDINAGYQVYACGPESTWIIGGKLLYEGFAANGLPDVLTDKLIRYITVSGGKLIIEVEE